MKLKHFLYIIFAVVSLFVFNDEVMAFDDKYGMYCEYADGTWFNFTSWTREAKFEFDHSDNLLISGIEAGRPGLAITESREIEWLKSKGLIVEKNSKLMFNCPTNPFGTNLGEATNVEFGKENGVVDDVETLNETYTCSYIGQMTGNTFKMTHTLTYDASTWVVTYPDGSKVTYNGNEINGNSMPSAACEDIFYTASEKRIFSVSEGGAYTGSIVSQYCGQFSDLEQFCNGGSCRITDPKCGSTNDGRYGGCPSELRPIIVFLKRVVINTLQILVPILLIVMGTIDLVKAVASNDDKSSKDAISKFIKRVLAAVMMFLITTIVTVVMNMIASTSVGPQDDWKSCWINLD